MFSIAMVLPRYHSASIRGAGATSPAHTEVLAGTDFFTVEVFTLKGLVTYLAEVLINWRAECAYKLIQSLMRHSNVSVTADRYV